MERILTSVRRKGVFLRDWVSTQGLRSLVLAVLFFLLGHASFLVSVQNVMVSPVLFAPVGIALAMAIRYGKGIWPGVFVGQFFLVLSRDLPVLTCFSIGATESMDVVLVAVLVRRLGIDPQLKRAKDLGLLFLIVLEPFGSLSGNLALYLGGMIANTPEFVRSTTFWWLGNVMTQMTVTPLLLLALTRRKRYPELADDLLRNLLLLLPTTLISYFLNQRFDFPSIWIIYVPAVVLIAIWRGLAAACISSILLATFALYITNRSMGPFFSNGQAHILDMNVFILGLTITGEFLAIMMEQISQQNLTEKKLEIQYRKKLEEKLQSSLAASAIAHEINQPLSLILLESHMALERKVDMRRAIEIIASEAKRVVRTIDKMKALMRNVETAHVSVDLTNVVRSTLLYTKGLVLRNAIEVSLTGLEKQILIEGDEAQLQLAFTNLIRNSVEAFAYWDPLEERPRKISISVSQTQGMVELTFADSGPGWPDGKIKNGIIPYTTKSTGSGLGLFIVRTAIENHHGTVTFGSSSLGGTEIKITLPSGEPSF